MRVSLTREVIDSATLLAEIASPACGASSLFLGTVREHNDGRSVTGIDYTAYEGMALRELRRIASECAARFETDRIAVAHRLGYLTLGEVSIGIAVAHERRNAAIEACTYVIEEVKKRVPIWKREHYVDGTREWVDPTRARVVEWSATE